MTPRYTHIWDVSIVLTHIAQQHPPEKLSLIDLSSKLATILALISAHRTQTIHNILLKDVNFSTSGTWITVSKLIKTSRPGSASPKFYLPKFDEKPELCATQILKAYISRTADLRGDEEQLFITTTRPFGPASKDTISRWIMRTLKDSGIDTSVFKTHSTRHASSSSALASGLSLATIKVSAGWTATSSVFQNFYNIPIAEKDQEMFANAILKR